MTVVALCVCVCVQSWRSWYRTQLCEWGGFYNSLTARWPEYPGILRAEEKTCHTESGGASTDGPLDLQSPLSRPLGTLVTFMRNSLCLCVPLNLFWSTQPFASLSTSRRSALIKTRFLAAFAVWSADYSLGPYVAFFPAPHTLARV